jgi:hypothetical protein
MFPPEELRKFTQSGRTIAAAVGTSVELWARAEAGVILKTWAGRTKVATQQSATRRAILQAYRLARKVAFGTRKGETPPGTASINLGFRGAPANRVWYRTRLNRKFQPVYQAGFSPGWHIRSSDWSRVELATLMFRRDVRDMIAAAKKAVGLARQSVVQIADSLGIRLESVKGGGALSAAGIAKARTALASNRRAYINGYGRQWKKPEDFVLELVNRYPRNVTIGMDATLASVIAGRIKYFERNLAEGTFLSAARAARAYPYLSVLKAAA